jgi:hypothetical protein
MTTGHQGAIWAFITEYRRVYGERPDYLRLVQDPEYRERCVERAGRSASTELQTLASSLSPLRPRRPAPAARHAAKAPEPVPEARRDDSAGPYERLLAQCLGDGEVTLDARESLDRLRRELALDAGEAVLVENRVRRQQERDMLRWPRELAANIERLTDADGNLLERDRLRLYQAYLGQDRVDTDQFEQMLELIRRRRTRLRRLRRPLAAGLGLLASAVALGAGYKLYQDRLAGAVGGVVSIAGSIGEDTLWRQDVTYRLDGIVFVENDAVLTIEAGTRVLGTPGSALIVTRDAKLYARGRRDAPILFTSSQPIGERHAGDWGGLVLLGNAPVNQGEALIEGLPAGDPRGYYGGNAERGTCGTLEYVRIEFAGHEVFANNELNGLTLGGCERGTVLRHIHVHRPLDDGIEFFGGEASLKNALVTAPGDDGLDWDMGWRGRVQNLIVHLYEGAGDNAIEADNWGDDPDATPRSAPVLYNVSLIGPGPGGVEQRAITLRRGTAARFGNLLIAGFPLEALDIGGGETAALARSGELRVESAIVYRVGADGAQWGAREQGDADDDGGFVDAAVFARPSVRLGVDPQFSALLRDPVRPQYGLGLDSPASRGGAALPEGEFWDTAAVHVGAIAPGAGDDWTAQWTSFPLN